MEISSVKVGFISFSRLGRAYKVRYISTLTTREKLIIPTYH